MGRLAKKIPVAENKMENKEYVTITVRLSKEEAAALIALAKRELRHPRDQARQIIRNELDGLRLLRLSLEVEKCNQ